MNSMILAAIAGFVWMELWTVHVALKKSKEKFSVGFYAANNWLLVLGNAVGTYLMFLLAPLVIVALRYAASRFVDDPLLVDELTDSLLAPAAGGAIGILGARFVRWVFGKGNTKLK